MECRPRAEFTPAVKLCVTSARRVAVGRRARRATACGARSAVVHGRPSLCRCILSIASADLEAVLYRIEGMPGVAW